MTILTMANVPAIGRTVQDFAEARDAVLEKIRVGLDYLEQAQELSNQFVTYGFPGELIPRKDLAGIRRELDSRYWQFVLDRTGAAAVMDVEARKQFKDALGTDKMPEFTMDNVTSQFLSMSQEASAMFARGVYNLFRRIAWTGKRLDLETNKRYPFEIGPKLILDGWFSRSWGAKLHVNYYRSDEVNDFGRIVNALAGKPYLPRGFEVEINAAMNDGGDTFENELLKVRGFKNGNAHVWIKDQKILDGINAQIAAYAGDQLPDASTAKYGARI